MKAIVLTGLLVCKNLTEQRIVERHLPEHVELTRAEPGCLHFEVEPTNDPLVWAVSERFADQAAFEAHQARTAASVWGSVTAAIAREYTIAP